MKIKRLLILIVLLNLCGVLSAAYLEYVPQKITQPDGTMLNCFASGDEYYHRLHDANGYTIIQNRETGFFVYAERRGEELVPTPLVPGIHSPSAAGLTPGLTISAEKYRQYFNSKYKDPFKSARAYNNSGSYNNLVIFIRFSNQNEFTEPLTQYSTAFNGSGTVSMTEYFKEVSKTQLSINTTFYPKPTGTTIVSYQDSHSRRYYQPYSVSNSEGYRTDPEYVDREMTLLKNACEFVKAQVEASGIDYDHDDDGNIDNVCFIVQGPTDGWSDLLWPHRWVLYTYDVRIGGLRVYDFNFQLSQALGVSVLCHEMFHSLGAPDLYRYVNDDITPVGPWDLMSHNKTPPQHMSAYMKMKYGKWFSQIPTITTDGTYTLKPLATEPFAAYKILSPNSTSEFFVIEYRKAAGRFETSLVGSGLIIYRVNSSLEGNAQGPPDEVYVYRQNGNTRTNGNINNATFSSTVGRTEFGDNTNPSSFLSNGSPGGIRITNIGAIGETISFTIGTGTTVFNPPQNLMAGLTGRTVSLSWEKPAAGNGTLSGYKVFRNQTLISTIPDINVLTYTDANLADGTFPYYVTASYVSPAGESGQSNTVTVTVGGANKPDLMITNPGIDPINVEQGNPVTLECIQWNRGSASAGLTMLRIYLSQDEVFDSGDRQLASADISPMDAGASVEVSGTSIPIPASISSGKWFVLFIADADGAVAESIENNNQAITRVTIGNPSLNPPRDLIAQVSPATVTLSWSEPEPGGGTLGGFYVYRNGAKIATVSDPALLTYTDSNLALGVYNYYLTAYYTVPIGESPRSNEVQVTLTNETKPDLTIQDFVVTPAVLAPGGSLNMSCTLLNIGGAQAPANLVQLYLSKDLMIDANDIILAYGTVDPLNAGDNTSITGDDIALPGTLTSGSWYALIMADVNAEIAESNETNNVTSVPLIVQGDAPDLQIVGISMYPLVIIQRTNVRVVSNVMNNGNLGASPVKGSFYLSKDETLDAADTWLFDISTRLLGAKGTIQLSSGFIIQANIVPGQYFLVGVVDPDGSIAESDETNNQVIISVIVAGTSGTGDVLAGQELNVYPVPATDWINIDFHDTGAGMKEIAIFNALGSKVFIDSVVPPGQINYQISVNQWRRGLYTLRILGGGYTLIRKIVIQ